MLLTQRKFTIKIENFILHNFILIAKSARNIRNVITADHKG